MAAPLARYLAAFTPAGEQPPFINFSLIGDNDVRVLLRGPVGEDGKQPFAEMHMTEMEFRKLIGTAVSNLIMYHGG